MCFQIIPLCPACEEPSGLGEEIIYAEDVCSGRCAAADVVGTTTRPMTQAEVDNRDFECLTPGCAPVASPLSAAEEDAATQGARDRARRFLRETHAHCRSLCILPFDDAPSPEARVRLGEVPVRPGAVRVPSNVALSKAPSDSDSAPLHGTAAKQPSQRGRPDRPWSKKRGKPWNEEEEAALWKLRHRGMEFGEIAKEIDRTERGCYDRYNKLRNEGFGRGHRAQHLAELRIKAKAT